MSRKSGGLTKWFKQDWVDIGFHLRRVVATLNVVGQSKRKMPSESILSVCLEQKLTL